MWSALVAAVLASTASESPAAALLPPGDHVRAISVDGRERTYRVHLPPAYDPARPTPVVLVFHGALTNGLITVFFTGMNETADRENFCVVYPDGTGKESFALTWNSGGVPVIAPGKPPDDVKYTRALLDDLAKVVAVDSRRTFATGISNGGMMCHRLAIELPDRIAAIAPVGGTLSLERPRPTARVPVLQIHGTADEIVPWAGLKGKPGDFQLRSVDETIAFWRRQNGCRSRPKVEKLSDTADDGATATRFTYAPAEPAPPGDGVRPDAEVVLIRIEGGGHTWPGRKAPLRFLGRSTADVVANDVIWEFFTRHPLPK
jgi:polyhydroxybutyrate depolymerase